MKKRDIRLQEYWWIYLVALILICFVWWGVFSYVDQVKDNQRITIAVYNSDCDTSGLRTHLLQKLPELSQQQILEFYVDDLDLQIESSNGKKLLSMQLLSTDFAIIPQSMLSQMDISIFFSALPEQLCSCGNPQLYMVDGTAYGIEITDTPFNEYCHSDESYYIFISGSSVNMAGLNGRGNSEDDAALALIYYLLGGEC